MTLFPIPENVTVTADYCIQLVAALSLSSNVAACLFVEKNVVSGLWLGEKKELRSVKKSATRIVRKTKKEVGELILSIF